MKLIMGALLAAVTAGSALAQDAPSTAEPEVRSTVIVGGTVVEDSKVTMTQSGLTISPVQETGAETARRDAAELLAAGSPSPVSQPEQPGETLVSVDNVVVSNKSPNATSCVQIGVVGARPNCRPPRQ